MRRGCLALFSMHACIRAFLCVWLQCCMILFIDMVTLHRLPFARSPFTHTPDKGMIP
jgi:hypothetical protein